MDIRNAYIWIVANNLRGRLLNQMFELKTKREMLSLIHKKNPRWRVGFSRAKEKLKNGTRHSLAPAGVTDGYTRPLQLI